MHDFEPLPQTFSTSEHLATEQIERILCNAIALSHRCMPSPSEALIVTVFQSILDRVEIPVPDTPSGPPHHH